MSNCKSFIDDFLQSNTDDKLSIFYQYLGGNSKPDKIVAFHNKIQCNMGKDDLDYVYSSIKNDKKYSVQTFHDTIYGQHIEWSVPANMRVIKINNSK